MTNFFLVLCDFIAIEKEKLKNACQSFVMLLEVSVCLSWLVYITETKLKDEDEEKRMS